MRLSRYIQRTRALGDAEVPAHDVDAIGDAIDGDTDLVELLKLHGKGPAKLSPRTVWGVWRAWHARKDQLDYLEQVRRRRHSEKKTPIPTTLMAQAAMRHEVGALERADAMAPPGSVSEHRRRDAIKTAVQVWNACLAIARRDGTLSIELVTEDPDRVEAFGDFAGNDALHDVSSHRWLAIRRGERAGALKLSLDVPHEQMNAQLAAHATAISVLARGRTLDTLLEPLVLDELEDAVFGLKDNEAHQQAIRRAAEAYLDLMTQPRPKAAVVAGVWVGRPGAPLAVAICLRDGRLVDQGEVDPGDNPVAAVEGLLGGHPVEAIALPTSAEDQQILNALAAGFEQMEKLRVKPAALRESLEFVGDDVPPSIGRALTIARRAVRPLKHWGQPDPISLGLAEYQQELDEGAVRACLLDMRALAGAGIKSDELSLPLEGSARAKSLVPRAPAPPLNPLVKSIQDVRPGMALNGTITNVAGFGAFVNVGLPHEGLIHVSELADHFVKDPSEVVKVGQQVSARVLGGDPGRGRISLSLKGDRRPPPPRREEEGPRGPGGVPLDDFGRGGGRGRSGPRPGGGRPGGGAGASGHSRTQALADLEALFKNKKPD